jgi:hypothetical protein
VAADDEMLATASNAHAKRFPHMTASLSEVELVEDTQLIP